MVQDANTIRQIEEYMRENNLNQTAMAVRLGIATSQLNRWLKNKRIGNAWIMLLKEKGVIKK